MRLLIVTGLPATGKSTLATQLAARYRLPLLAKDSIKETLLDDAGPVDAAGSRKLSDLAFNMLFSQLRQHVDAGTDTVLEGNFRAGQHETQLATLPAVRVAQILCRVEEDERRRRIVARAIDPLLRHRGHGDGQAPRDASNDRFLDLPGERLLFTAHESAMNREVLLQLDRWWHAAAGD